MQQQGSAAQLLPHDVREGAWPEGRDGWVALPATAAGGKPSPFLALRLGLGDWFSGPHITVSGIPFRVPAAPEPGLRLAPWQRDRPEIPGVAHARSTGPGSDGRPEPRYQMLRKTISGFFQPDSLKALQTYSIMLIESHSLCLQ